MPRTSKTAVEQLSFGSMIGMDKDIESPLHDEMALWLDKNANEILGSLFPWAFSAVWPGETLEELRLQHQHDSAPPSRFGDPPERKVELRKEWQYPILRYLGPQKEKTILGFVDLKVNVLFSSLGFTDGIGWELRVPGGAPGLVVFCEVAPAIQVSKLLRQLKAYKELVETEPCVGDEHEKEAFVIVSPDDRYADKLSEEGFHFVKYDPTLFG